MKDRTVLVLVVATLGGVASVVCGWVLQGPDYLPSLLLQFGSSLVLVVPLVVLGRMLENRIRGTEESAIRISETLTDVKSQVHATAIRLDNLAEATRDRLRRAENVRRASLQETENDPSQPNIKRLLTEAIDVGAIAPEGVRIKLPGGPLRLNFSVPDGNDLSLTVEERNGTPLATLGWPPSEPVDAMTARLVIRLKNLQKYPGDDVFDTSVILQRFIETLRIGLQGVDDEEGLHGGLLIEMPNAQWAIAADGLYCVEQPYRIEIERLLNSQEDWRKYMLTKDWVDVDQFLEAYDIVLDLHRFRTA
jgi:hypothetical protein